MAEVQEDSTFTSFVKSADGEDTPLADGAKKSRAKSKNLLYIAAALVLAAGAIFFGSTRQPRPALRRAPLPPRPRSPSKLLLSILAALASVPTSGLALPLDCLARYPTTRREKRPSRCCATPFSPCWPAPRPSPCSPLTASKNSKPMCSKRSRSGSPILALRTFTSRNFWCKCDGRGRPS